MKIRAAIELAAHVAAKNGTLPILAHVKIADGRVVSNDLSQQIDVPIDLPPELAKAAFCVHAARLVRVLKALPEDLELGLAMKEQRLVITAGKTRYELNTMPPDDFPGLEPVDEPTTDLEVPSKDLIAALRFVAPAAAINDIRYFLNGVHVQIEASRIILTATDGHRLHRVRISIPPRSGEPVQGIVANVSIARLVEIATRHERVTLSLSATRFAIEDDEVLLTKLIDGAYPDADRVIPGSRTATAGIARVEFLTAVKRMGAIGPKAVTLGFAMQAITLSAANTEGEAASEDFEWNASGAKFKPVVLAFPGEQLIDAFNAFTCTRVNLHVGAEKESLYLTDDGDGSHQVVLMPYRV